MPSAAQIVELFDPVAVILLLTTVVVFAIPVFILFPPIPVERSDALQQTHTKVGIAPSHSNLRAQTSPDHNHQPGKAARIQSLFIYPVKSCRGIEVDRSRVLPKGLEFDRLFAFARQKPEAGRDAAVLSGEEGEEGARRAAQWEVLTLRQVPLLANVQVDLWLPDAGKTSRQLGRVGGRFVVIRFPWRDSGLRGVAQWISAKLSRGLGGIPEREFMLSIDFPSPEEIKAAGYCYGDARLFNKTIHALNLRNEVPPELALYLGVAAPVTIFMIDPARRREVMRNAPRKEDAGYQPVIDFQDAYPLHLLNLTSVRALESKVQKDQDLEFLDARRFRPNIIVSGLKAYDEDDWRSIEFSRPFQGDAAKGSESPSRFDVSCRTVRCKLPNVDPATGIKHKAEPDRSLRKFRNIDEGAPKSGCFGMQLCPIFPETSGPDEGDLALSLEVGMDLKVLQRGPHLAL
ncbi:uncharacterized protein TRIREDRAFT_21442 [Trichoderma reesei QM6a]|uniref:Predicted protein n=2 Tax=Hypocrea jecorina TaxID=51453 RepID=G0RAT8_HYPJQ|nr:uncharacterized protein TRIREDRAFT_21442 [Trichoderma reesei QM6a]EGR51916.1 predicted protein [Trichoderma reesei QM6a]ETR97761.1 MOSC domain-containing protein [Trichoderma reesei RUT C-30]